MSIAKRLKLDGIGKPLFLNPAGLALDRQGNIWVADKGFNRLDEISNAGTLIRHGSRGSEPGQFHERYGAAVTGLGHLLVADTENSRVQSPF